MKKAISLVLLCLCIFIIYQVGINFIKTTHTVTYSINNEKKFKVTENFKNNNYYFEITADNYKFYYKDDNLFNKAKNVIKDIKSQEENGMLCIYPVYEKKDSIILCSDKSTVYTYEIVKNRPLASSFKTKLENDGYTFKIKDDEDNTAEPILKDNITYYQSNFNKKETTTLWTYEGFIVFNSERSTNFYPIDFDRYENTISTLISKYYITPIYIDNKLFEFSKVYIYDVLTNSEYELELGVALSNYTYVNGIANNKLYLMDPSNIIQLSIDPKGKKVEVVGNKEKGGIYYKNGKLENINIYDLVNSKVTFKIDDSSLKKKYNYNSVYENSDSYFFYTGSKLYKVYKDKLDIPILIAENNNLKQIKVKNDTVYYIVENTIYKYENNRLVKPLLTYNELIYNNSNMYDIYN